MPHRKYLFLQRSATGNQTGNQQQPSPAQMQEMYAAFNAWKERFKDNILEWAASSCPAARSSPRPERRTAPLRRSQGDRRRLHARVGREPRACAGGREGNADADARSEHRDTRGGGPVIDGPRVDGHPGATAAPGLVEHFFRHEVRPSGRVAHAQGGVAPHRRR